VVRKNLREAFGKRYEWRLSMHYRRLGRTGLEVSEVGYGAWGIGKDAWLGAEDNESLRALNGAIDLGLNFIDTALSYGEGHSERLVGQVVREWDETVYVATKIPPKNRIWPAPSGLHPDEVFPKEYVRECTETSLRNLGLEAIDVQQFHVWSDEWVGQGDWLEAAEGLKSEGKIRFFGVSINDHQPANAVRLIETGVVDTVQVIYNVFDQAPEDELFGRCQAGGIAVIARVPYDEGSLTGTLTRDSRWPDGDFRNTYFGPENLPETVTRVEALRAALPAGMTLPELALRFVLHHPAVSVAIPGMRSLAHVRANLAVGDAPPLPADLLRELRGHRWDRTPAAWSG